MTAQQVHLNLSFPFLLCLCLFFYVFLAAQQTYSGHLFVSLSSLFVHASSFSTLPLPICLLLFFFFFFLCLSFYVLLSALQVYSDFLFACSSSSMVHSSSCESLSVGCRCTKGRPQRQPSSARSHQDLRHMTSMAPEWEGRSVSCFVFERAC